MSQLGTLEAAAVTFAAATGLRPAEWAAIERRDIDNLLAAGLSAHAVVSLSQLIAYVNFQARVLAGLRMLKG